MIAIDDDAIEIQYLDGTVEGLDHDAWLTLSPKEINPPREALAQDYQDDGGEEHPHYSLGDLESDPIDWPANYDEYDD